MAVPDKDLLAAIEREHPQESRSTLSRWMRRNHDALLERIGDRPDWQVLARLFGEHGLTDRSGKPASPQAARKAWERVRKGVAASRVRQQPKAQTAAQTVRVAGAQAAETPRRKFQISTPKPPKPHEDE